MFKKNRFAGNQQNPGFINPYQNFTGQNYENDRILYEIKENRRRINNLAKRIVRLENYLRIRDTSEYSIIEDDNLDNIFPNKPN